MFYRFFELIFNALQGAIFIEVILSWVYRGTNQYVELLHKITGPLLEPGRKIQDKYFGNTMVDFSPIIALFILMMLKSIVLGLLSY
ncbi:YggT family protein [Clostridium sp. FP2]|uniref:YggT family protein n=1 Tax=Clostridium TaxID=1485 RepID=UPI0013E8FBD3|nr:MULTISPECIES: YggT family protein [Clostridium]MBU3126603.1 YggT family protein [Clostridium tagluense]MBW9154906.1 YggT family protein [Clostridium tagluense]MBZ9624497.1 YggT family protein [Clostridium sp. FP2]WLC64360.1 YggT family protein [Clostridium tagluense]